MQVWPEPLIDQSLQRRTRRLHRGPRRDPFHLDRAPEQLAAFGCLTLYITPVIYLYLERMQEWLRGETDAGPVAVAEGD